MGQLTHGMLQELAGFHAAVGVDDEAIGQEVLGQFRYVFGKLGWLRSGKEMAANAQNLIMLGNRRGHTHPPLRSADTKSGHVPRLLLLYGYSQQEAMKAPLGIYSASPSNMDAFCQGYISSERLLSQACAQSDTSRSIVNALYSISCTAPLWLWLRDT